jgi:hypothetical protein
VHKCDIAHTHQHPGKLLQLHRPRRPRLARVHTSLSPIASDLGCGEGEVGRMGGPAWSGGEMTWTLREGG